MKGKMIYPGGWIKTTYAHKLFGRDALQACVECGAMSAGTVWIHEYDGPFPDGIVRAVPERRVVRCYRHPPPEADVWDWSMEPSVAGRWSSRYGDDE